jgi:5-methylthioribose kinase
MIKEKYYVLDKSNIINYTKSIPLISNFFGSDDLIAKEIGDGNMNFVFLVQSVINPKKALILKQAVPYLRCLGEDFKLDRTRIDFEIESLREFEKLDLDMTPKIIYSSKNMSVIAMQYLDDSIILRRGLINKTKYPKFSHQIAKFLANSMFKTSSLYLNNTEKLKLIDRFNKSIDLPKLTQDYLFTFAFMEHPSNRFSGETSSYAKELFCDMEFKKELLKLKYKFLTKQDALLHGDLHTGSIMLDINHTYVIDSEFCLIGAFGFDTGLLVANLLLSYCSCKAFNSSRDYQEWIVTTVKDILENFEIEFLKLWDKHRENSLLVDGFMSEDMLHIYKKEFMLDILRDSIGYAGIEMARRLFGAVGADDIEEIKDIDKKDRAIKLALTIATYFVKNSTNINSVDEVIDFVSTL